MRNITCSACQKLPFGSFSYTACLENTSFILNSLSLLILKSFIVPYLNEGGKAKKILVFVKYRTANLPLSNPSSPSGKCLYLQSSSEFS